MNLSGSSPLARGTHQLQPIHHAPNGLIPARAGNTSVLWSLGTLTWAHPRSRGEHGCRRYRFRQTWGSSPLARGTLSRVAKNMKPPGLIPARAGNTNSTVSLSPCIRAHPRSRGEHQCGLSAVLIRRGSSPLARGTQTCLFPFEMRGGLIPARAGNTWVNLKRMMRVRAHPRSRGEHR